MKLYAFLDKKPVIFDTEDIAEMFAYDGLLITLKDGHDYDCAHHISAFPELLPDYDLEKAIEIGKEADVFTNNTGLFEILKRLREK